MRGEREGGRRGERGRREERGRRGERGRGGDRTREEGGGGGGGRGERERAREREIKKEREEEKSQDVINSSMFSPPTPHTQVFFAVLIGAFALGQAFPNLENLTSAAGASITIFETIDRVCPCNNHLSLLCSHHCKLQIISFLLLLETGN